MQRDETSWARRYRKLRGSAPWAVREASSRHSAFPYTERHLQCVWYDSAYRPALLISSDGEHVQVEFPGRWNVEAGPDFLDAVLIIGPERRRVRGDVEIHVRAGDWLSHAHGSDPRYDRVVAHISYFDGFLPPEQMSPHITQCALRSALAMNPGFCFECIDVTAYPYASRTASDPPCGRCLRRQPPEEHVALLEAAGEERLRVKTLRFGALIEEQGAEQAAYEELMAALGYKHNRVPFRQLARLVPLEVLRAEACGDVDRAYALLLGVSGLIPDGVSPRWDDATRAFVRRLWDVWWKQQAQWESRRASLAPWRLSGVRPHNHPRRRLAAAAALVTAGKPLVPVPGDGDAARPRDWLTAATAALTRRARHPYWDRRLGLGGSASRSATALLGASRARAIVTNVVLPFHAAAGHDVRPFLDALPPEQDNALIRYAANALFGRDHNPALYANGLRQQGLIQIFHDFCLGDRSGCHDCALAATLAGNPPTDPEWGRYR